MGYYIFLYGIKSEEIQKVFGTNDEAFLHEPKLISEQKIENMFVAPPYSQSYSKQK